jgi:hypothetical protein
MAHPVREIVIEYEESGHPPTALLLYDFKNVPFPEFPSPAYIT